MVHGLPRCIVAGNSTSLISTAVTFTPTLRLLIDDHLQIVVNLLALGQQFIQFRLTQNVAQGRLPIWVVAWLVAMSSERSSACFRRDRGNVAPFLSLGSSLRRQPDVMKPEGAQQHQRGKQRENENLHHVILYCQIVDTLFACSGKRTFPWRCPRRKEEREYTSERRTRPPWKLRFHDGEGL